RVAQKGFQAKNESTKFSNDDEIMTALCSPNSATRYLAAQHIEKLDDKRAGMLLYAGAITSNDHRQVGRATWQLATMWQARPTGAGMVLLGALEKSAILKDVRRQSLSTRATIALSTRHKLPAIGVSDLDVVDGTKFFVEDAESPHVHSLALIGLHHGAPE